MIQTKSLYNYRNMYAVEYSKGLAVSVGASGEILTTRNNKDWKKRKNPQGSSALYDVCTNGKIWMACGASGILRSIDGEIWEYVYSTREINGIKTDGKIFVGVNNANYSVVSEDNGVTWKEYNIGESGFYGFNFTNNRFVFISNNYLWTSHEGRIWTRSIDSFAFSTWKQFSSANNTSHSGVEWDASRQRYRMPISYGSTVSGTRGGSMYYTGLLESDGNGFYIYSFGPYNGSYGGTMYYTNIFKTSRMRTLKDGSRFAFLTTNYGFLLNEKGASYYAKMDGRFTEGYYNDFYETEDGGIYGVGQTAIQRQVFTKKSVIRGQYTPAESMTDDAFTSNTYFLNRYTSEAQTPDGKTIIRTLHTWSAQYAVSHDYGKTWKFVGASSYKLDIIYVEKLHMFIACGLGSASTAVQTSVDDGDSWTNRSHALTATHLVKNVQWFEEANGGQGLIVVTNNYNEIATSPDGITWTKRFTRVNAGHIRKVVRSHWYDKSPEFANLAAFPADGKVNGARTTESFRALDTDKYYNFNSATYDTRDANAISFENREAFSSTGLNTVLYTQNDANAISIDELDDFPSTGINPVIYAQNDEDAISFDELDTFPETGMNPGTEAEFEPTDVIKATDTGKHYSWSGSAYVEINETFKSTDVIKATDTGKHYSWSGSAYVEINETFKSTDVIKATDTGKHYSWSGSAYVEFATLYSEIAEIYRYIAAFNSTNLIWSKDLITWTQKSGGSATFIDIASNEEGVIVLTHVGTEAWITTLEKGWVFTNRTIPRTSVQSSVDYDPINRVFLTFGYNTGNNSSKYYSTSLDGKVWIEPLYCYLSQYNPGGGGLTADLHFRNGKFMWYNSGGTDYCIYSYEANIVSTYDYTCSSGVFLPFIFTPQGTAGQYDDENTTNYIIRNINTSSIHSMHWDGEKYLATTDTGIWYSYDGYDWKQAATATDSRFYFILMKEGLYYAVGGDASYRFTTKSTDKGLTWKTPASTTDYSSSGTSGKWLWKAAHNGSFIVALSHRDKSAAYIYIAPFLYNTDANSWTEIAVPQLPRAIIHDGTEFVVVGNGGMIVTSVDGVVWTSRTSGVTTQLNAIKFINNKYIATGVNGTVLVSTDKESWVKKDAGYTGAIEDVTKVGHDIILVTSDINNLYISEDLGESWFTKSLTYQLPPNLQNACYDREIHSDVTSIITSYNNENAYCKVYSIDAGEKPPVSVTIPSALVETSKFRITWPSAQHGTNMIAKYELQRRIDSGVWETVYIGENLNYEDTVPSVENANSIVYRVRSVSTDPNEDESGYSSSLVATVVAIDVYIPLDPNTTIPGQFEMTPPSFDYNVPLVTSNGLAVTKIKEFIDNTLIREYVPSADTATVTILYDDWIKIKNGVHAFRIEAEDESGLINQQYVDFTKNVTSVVFHFKVPLPSSIKPTKAQVDVQSAMKLGSVQKVYACNNGFDSAPAWEDVTSYVKEGKVFPFANEEKESIQWGVDVKVDLRRGSSVGECYVGAVGGNFA